MNETDRLLERLEALERANAELRAELAAMRSRPEMTPRPDSCEDEAVSRRGLLKKVGGAVVAGVAGAAVGDALGAAPAGAANGDPVLAGRTNEATSVTFVDNGQAFAGLSQDGLYGVFGRHDAAFRYGVWGHVKGANSIGVNSTTVGHFSQIAVQGDTTSGVGEGIGVYGKSTNGIGLLGEAIGGHALQVRGRAVFSRSGKSAFAQGQASKTIPVGLGLTAESIVLAVIQGNPAGTWVRAVSLDVANGRFTVRLNKAAPVALTVGWFVVN